MRKLKFLVLLTAHLKRLQLVLKPAERPIESEGIEFYTLSERLSGKVLSQFWDRFLYCYIKKIKLRESVRLLGQTLVILFFLNVSILAQTQKYNSKSDDPSPEWTEDPDKKTRIGKEESGEDILKGKPLPKSTNFLVYGASVGSPGGINLNLGYYYKDVVLRVSGGKWNSHWWGGQVDIGYSFWKTPVIAHSISLVFGKFQVDPFEPEIGRGGQNSYPSGSSFPGYSHRDPTYEDLIIRSYVTEQNPDLALYLEYESRDRQKVHLNQQYVGLAYDFLLGNFFLQLGGGIGKGDYKNPQLLIQVGYLFDTR